MLRRLLRWTLASVGADSSEKEIGALLDPVLADLEALNRSTERDFLGIGAKLAEFAGAARQISTDMAALSELISGASGQDTSLLLERILERSKQTETQARAGDTALARVGGVTRQISSTFRGLQDTVAVFRVLGSLTRVETARLGSVGAEFGNLAEEVNSLTKNIESSGQGILDASTSIQRSMESALAKVTGLRASELRELPLLIDQVMSGLGSLEERQSRAMEASQRQAEEYGETSSAIGDLITAIQFQDITRQQIEHVRAALEQLDAELEAAGRSRSAARPDARFVLQVQCSQLSNTRDVFASSVDRIEKNLDSIAGRVRGMAQAGQTLLGSSADEQGSFFLQMGNRLESVLRLVGLCDSAEAETRTALEGLHESVERMRNSVEEVRMVEIRIRRIAINATIRAVQIGQAGSALNVLAEVMHRLALDSQAMTDRVAEALDAITEAARNLDDEDGQPSDNVSDQVHAAILEMQASSEISFRRLQEITDLSARLGEEIRSVRAGFKAGEVFDASVERALFALEQAGSRTAADGLGARPVADSSGSADVASRYTMQAERDVHEAVSIGLAAARSHAPPAATGDPELGANVELF